jgi:GH25 family lysozyme M1 (1,4-beta-N-acetylmuramidase)
MGIIADLSKWQGTIDFGKLKSQVDFVILRVQAGYTSVDSKYKEYAAGCKANGIPFGTYAYFKGVSIPDSIAEAKNALELTDPDSKFFALDIEENCNRDLVGTGQAFIDYLKNKGVQKVGLYSGESFFNAHNLGVIRCDFVWIAKYGPNDGQQHTKPSVACDLWQYTSVGRLDGIAGNVDLNVLTGSKTLEYFTGYYGGPAYKVIIPNTAFWQAKGLVIEFQQRGFTCYGHNLKTYGPGQQPADGDPYQFIIETCLEDAKQLVIELQQRGYDRTFGEAI